MDRACYYALWCHEREGDPGKIHTSHMVKTRTTNHHGSQDHGLQFPASRAAGPEAAAQLKEIKADYPGKREASSRRQTRVVTKRRLEKVMFCFWNYVDLYFWQTVSIQLLKLTSQWFSSSFAHPRLTSRSKTSRDITARNPRCTPLVDQLACFFAHVITHTNPE